MGPQVQVFWPVQELMCTQIQARVMGKPCLEVM